MLDWYSIFLSLNYVEVKFWYAQIIKTRNSVEPSTLSNSADFSKMSTKENKNSWKSKKDKKNLKSEVSLLIPKVHTHPCWSDLIRDFWIEWEIPKNPKLVVSKNNLIPSWRKYRQHLVTNFFKVLPCSWHQKSNSPIIEFKVLQNAFRMKKNKAWNIF